MSSSKEIIFNIIIRTSNRPQYFNNCIKSIHEQDYQSSNIYKFITFDSENDVDSYIQKVLDKYSGEHPENDILIEVTQTKRKNKKFFPYNLYINEVYQHIENGWIIILNDDNIFKSSNSLSMLAESINSNNLDTNTVK